jgi:hypothetical protein
MHYLLFNGEILISDGKVVKKITREEDSLKALGPIERAKVCHVDADVMIASAPEDYLDQKDSLLAKKFAEFYCDEYITQDERIDSNVFQVIGIKAQKVKEIYSLIPSSKVEVFVPYAVAVRSLLMNHKTDMTRPVVLVDDLGHEKLITVFDGLKFSRTRTIYSDKTETILPDIKRSHIDFNKKLGEFANNKPTGHFTVIANNKPLADEIKLLDPEVAVEFLDSQYPALEGLACTDSLLKYRIPEDIIQDRKKTQAKARFKSVMISLLFCACGALFFGCNQIQFAYLEHELQQEQIKNHKFTNDLNALDRIIYKDSLRDSKKLDYSSAFFELSNLLPSAYGISTFKFARHGDHWVFSTYVFARDDEFYDQIPRIKILKNALIKDFYIRDHPGKYIKVDL